MIWSQVGSSNKNSFEMYGVESKSVQSEFCIILYFQLVQNGKIEWSCQTDVIHTTRFIWTIQCSLRSFSCMLWWSPFADQIFFFLPKRQFWFEISRFCNFWEITFLGVLKRLLVKIVKFRKYYNWLLPKENCFYLF